MVPQSYQFLLTCLLRGMTGHKDCSPSADRFLLTCLLRGMTMNSGRAEYILSVSTHMPLARHDEHLRERHRQERMFLLTCLLRGMTQVTAEKGCNSKFLLTCLLRGMTHFLLSNMHQWQVSTHMPLARHDISGMLLTFFVPLSFYSHASCEA